MLQTGVVRIIPRKVRRPLLTTSLSQGLVVKPYKVQIISKKVRRPLILIPYTKNKVVRNGSNLLFIPRRIKHPLILVTKMPQQGNRMYFIPKRGSGGVAVIKVSPQFWA